MILFSDDRFLVVNKPAGVSMAVSRQPGKDEATVVRRLIEATGTDVLDPLPLMVHRLDVGTSGVVLLAKSKDAHREVSMLFQDRTVEKTYRALVFGHPVPARGRLEEALGRDPKDGRKMRVDPLGKPAVTVYSTLCRYTGLTDLSLQPETGRTHQIRVHLAAKGHPIAGDPLYGGSERWRGIREPEVRKRLRDLEFPLLHAARLALPPLNRVFEAPLPTEYAELLDALSRNRIRD